MKFFIETYGCTSNHGNSREAEAALIELGHIPSTLKDADALIVNTCAVTEKTERKILKRLRQIQGGRLFIAGCLPAALPSSLDHLVCCKKVGILNRWSAGEIAKSFPSSSSADTARPTGGLQSVCGIINIAEGCKGCCSYCIVKLARGELASRDPDDIVEEAASLIEQGYSEIQLAAQDTAAYGLDIESGLPELAGRIAEIPGDFMIRIGMANPRTVLPILEEMADIFKLSKVYKFLHMPVQSGSDAVLESMCRGYRAEDYCRIVQRFSEKVPEMSFATDVIAGFPGETDQDFAKTLRLIELTRPDKVNITRYSRRPGTPASKLYDMPDRIKKERSRRLTRLWLKVARENNQRYLGKTLRVMVTERGRGNSMKARADNYAGVVIPGRPVLGSIQNVRITGCNSVYLLGR